MIKLYYFELAGRAEPIRLLLNHAGIKFEDKRIPAAEWPVYKEKFELKQLPVLDIDGKILVQSYAILEYLGAKYGYLPKNYNKLYRVLYIMNTAEDLFFKVMPFLNPRSPLDEKGKAEAKKNLLESTGPLYMSALEKTLKENCCQDFMVGCKYTIADFYILGLYQHLLQNEEWKKLFEERIVKKYPLLHAYAQKRLMDFNGFYKKCKPKLYYFDMPGRAEMIRCMLKFAKMPFEDVRIKFEEWPALKTSGKFELQQLPMLECEPCGFRLCQSDAIMHRFGARLGFLPLDKPEKLYKIIWWCNTLKDLLDNLVKFAAPSAIPEEKKKQMKTDYFEKTVPTQMQAMENRLKLNKFQVILVGNRVSIADFYFVGMWRYFHTSFVPGEFSTILPKYPTLAKYFEHMNKLC